MVFDFCYGRSYSMEILLRGGYFNDDEIAVAGDEVDNIVDFRCSSSDCFNRFRIGHNRWRSNTGYRDPNLNRGRRCIDKDGETFIGQIFSATGRSAMGTGKYELQLSCCLLPEGKSSPPLIPPESTVTVAVPFCTWLPFRFSYHQKSSKVYYLSILY
ncbi:unnamed protein product [Lactuca virosa]|uniref:Uncharacterized protein n=1 Tax=Lactuca virosa TaxID=75947 RepID=A0AAU9PQ52_9ASTR|nr:unnamed protein product [Lactuca virosa]